MRLVCCCNSHGIFQDEGFFFICTIDKNKNPVEKLSFHTSLRDAIKSYIAKVCNSESYKFSFPIKEQENGEIKGGTW